MVPKGTNAFVDVPAVHTNPANWPNPHDFDPSRFSRDWDRDAFLPFSTGPRASVPSRPRSSLPALRTDRRSTSCIGRRFAEVETVCATTLFVQHFKMHARPGEGESVEQMRQRLLHATEGISLTPHDVDLVFERR